MNLDPLVTSMVWLPKDGLHSKEYNKLKKDCTIRYQEYGEAETHTLKTYRITENYIVVPRDFGLNWMRDNGWDWEEHVSYGYEAFDGIEPVKLYGYQKPWVTSMIQMSDMKLDYIGQAATGKGKTVMATAIAQSLGRTTLVIVDQENLMNQWMLDTWRDVFAIPESRIGYIRSTKCNYEDTDICIAMLQSLVARKDKYPKEMFQYFGTVIFDEVHSLAAPVYQQALAMFPAATRFGVTATLKRGPLKKLSDLHLGKGAAVVMTEKHKKSSVRVIENDSIYSWYANISPKDGRFTNEIAADSRRNKKLVDAIYWLWDSGRDVLVIGARIEQLEALMVMLHMEYGIAMEEMGLYTGRRTEWRMAKDKHPTSKPKHLQSDAEYTPVCLQKVDKKNNANWLDEVKESARIIFATYGKFAKGANVPRLSAGVDATPRSNVEQVHGRILRSTVPKLSPIWVTMRDKNSYRAEFQLSRRISDYVKSNAEVYLWRMGKGVKKVDPKQFTEQLKRRVDLLKEARLGTNDAGNNTLTMPDTGNR